MRTSFGGALVEALGAHKLTVISVPGASLPASELQQLGVARVSTGPFTQRVALTALFARGSSHPGAMRA